MKNEEKEEKIEETKDAILTLKNEQSEAIRNLLDKVKELEKDRDMLLQVADKKQMSIYYQRNKGKIPSRVMLRTIMNASRGEEKVIIGWKTIEDEVYVDPNTMRWTEKQKVSLIYEDGTSEDFHLMDYVRKYKQVEAEVRSRMVDEVTGNVTLKVVRLDNGKEYTIGENYIN